MEEIDHLTRLIDQILTLARVEAGQISTDDDAVDLGELAAPLVSPTRTLADVRSQRVVL